MFHSDPVKNQLTTETSVLSSDIRFYTSSSNRKQKDSGTAMKTIATCGQVQQPTGIILMNVQKHWGMATCEGETSIRFGQKIFKKLFAWHLPNLISSRSFCGKHIFTRSKWGKPHKLSDDKFILAGYYFLMIDTCRNHYLNLTNLYSISGHWSGRY